MVFNIEYRILVENLYKFKGYRAKNIVNFLTEVGLLMVWNIYWRNWETPVPQQTARQPGSGRRQSVRTAENVDTVNDLVLSNKGALKCIKPRVKLQERPAFITRQCMYSIIHQVFQWKCLKKRRAQELTTASVYISQTGRSCYKVE